MELVLGLGSEGMADRRGVNGGWQSWKQGRAESGLTTDTASQNGANTIFLGFGWMA